MRRRKNSEGGGRQRLPGKQKIAGALAEHKKLRFLVPNLSSSAVGSRIVKETSFLLLHLTSA